MGFLSEIYARVARRPLGKIAVTAHARPRYVALLRVVFDLLAEESSRGEGYRRLVEDWPNSRRVVAKKMDGYTLHLELDEPRVGRWWNLSPIGGRIFSSVQGTDKTWIELTPAQASELEQGFRRSVQNTLEEWLKKNDVRGKVVDETGVKIQSNFRTIDPATLFSDDDFYKNEIRITRQLEQESLVRNRKKNDDASTKYYEGFWGFPSRCHIIHYREQERAFFALAHPLSLGGTSPTNMFETLATQFRAEFYPDIYPDHIDWFDHWPAENSLTYKDETTRVRMIWDSKKNTYREPEWGGEPAPQKLIDEVKTVMDRVRKVEQ